MSPYVFVKHYFNIGDADGSVQGFGVVKREVWEQSSETFLTKIKEEFQDIEDPKTYRFVVDRYNEYIDVIFTDYKVKDCSEEELQSLIKFFNSTYNYDKEKGIMISEGSFVLPDYWLQFIL